VMVVPEVHLVPEVHPVLVVRLARAGLLVLVALREPMEALETEARAELQRPVEAQAGQLVRGGLGKRAEPGGPAAAEAFRLPTLI